VVAAQRSTIIEDINFVIDEMAKFDSVKHALRLSKGALVVDTHIQTVFGMRFTSPRRQSIHELIVSYALTAERMGPGSFNGCIRRCQQLLGGTHGTHQPRTVYATPPSTKDVDWVIGRYGLSMWPNVMQLVRYAVDLAGLNGKIIVERSSSSSNSVELIDGHTFSLQSTVVNRLRLTQPRVICVDGFIESVGEVHRLLQAASEEKTPVVLFVRGLTDDVKHTIKVNNDRGTLQVFPVIVKFDLEGINTLNDVAVVAGCDLVSSHKGDLISSIDMRSGSIVDRIVIDGNRITIINPATRERVKSHVSALRIKRSKEEVIDVSQLIDARIRSLLPRHVIVRIKDNSDYVRVSQAIDYTLRALQSLIERGTIETPAGKELAATYWAIEHYAVRCVDQLRSLGEVIRVT